MPDVYAEHALDSRRFLTEDSVDGTLYMGRPIGDPLTFWANVTRRAEISRRDQQNLHYCARCGEVLPCTHINCSTVDDSEHALRIRARYALGRVHNPDHDTTDYRDPHG